MSNVNANINVLVNTAQATAQIRALQAQINALNATIATGGKSSQAALANLNNTFAQSAAASGLFNARIVPMTHSVDQFSKHLDRGTLSLNQYSRGVMSQMPMMSKRFRREFDTMAQVAESRVKRLQTQYMALGNTQKALALTPAALNMKDFTTQQALAAQRQMIMNKMISDGSTKLVNWGKNTQWAGRQLMVGFTMPLLVFGGVAAKTFMDLDKQARDFKRVYGDAFTPPSEIEANIKAVQELGAEYTKYGIKLSDTMEIAATAAAAGMRNEQLMSGTEETLRLATIGQIDYNQALQTTITLQNAFRVANEDMTQTVDFMGAVANQTVLTVDDITKAIPRVAPVIAGLGGDIKDLAALLTAMREGGVSAEQGANALKSGLASLINPTKEAKKALAGMGIDIEGIVQMNRGDLMGTIQDFATALKTLDAFGRQQALEKVFGKYQYARLGALFDNISKKGTQAATVLDLAGKSAQELGALSAKSLNEVEQSTTAKFQAAVERMKIAIAPVGEAFLKALTPIIGFVTKIAEKFNELPDNIKSVIGTIAAMGGIIAPAAIMLVGLFANFFGMFIKGVQIMRRFFAWMNKNSAAFKYMAGEELDAAAAAATLEGKTTALTDKLLLQQEAVRTLTTLYGDLAAKAATLAGAMGKIPAAVVPPVGAAGAPMGAPQSAGKGGGFWPFVPRFKAASGITKVPGSGNGDTVPALLTPGEAVVNKKAAQKYGPIIGAMNAGTIQGFSDGFPERAYGPMNISPEPVGSARSHVIGMTPDTLAKTLVNGLESNNKMLQKFVQDQLAMSKMYMATVTGSGAARTADIGERTKFNLGPQTSATELRGIQNLVTSNFAGTALVSPTARNSHFFESNILPQNVRGGEAIFQDDYNEQRRIASSEAALKNPVPSVREGAEQFRKEAVELEKQGLLDKKQEVAFLKNRLTLMGVQEKIDNGIITEKSSIKQIVAAQDDAEKAALAKIQQMQNMGLISNNQIANKAGITQFLAASAVGANPSVGSTSENVPSRLIKRMGRGQGVVYNVKGATTYAGEKFRGLKNAATGNKLFRTGTDALNSRAVKAAAINDMKAYEEARRSVANPVQNDAAIVSRDKSSRNSPHKQMKIDGRDDQMAYDKARRDAAQKAARTPLTTQSVFRNQQKMQAAGIDTLQGQTRTLRRMYGVTEKVILQELVKIDDLRTKIRAEYMKQAGVVKTNDQIETRVTRTMNDLMAAKERDYQASIKRLQAEEALAAATAKGAGTTTATAETAAGTGRFARARGAISGFFGAPSGNNGQTRGQRMAGAANGAVMGLMGLSMAASFAGGSIGEMAQKIMPLTMGLMGLQMILPLFTNPFGLAIIAVTAASAAFVKARMDIDNLAKEAARAGANLGGVADGLKLVEEATGWKAPTAEDRLFRFSADDKKAMGDFAGFFEGEKGSKFVEDLKSVSQEERYQKVASMLTQAVASGLDPEKAKAFGQAIAKATGDYMLNSQVIRDFQTGAYRGGSDRLLALEQSRQTNYAPNAPEAGARSQNDITGTYLGAAGLTALAVGALLLAIPTGGLSLAAGAGIAAGAGLVAGGAAYAGTRGQQEELDKQMETAGKGLGFALQTAQNLANIEAVLAEERKNGVITTKQYLDRMAEVNRMQDEQGAYFARLFENAGDSGALAQAMKDQLIAGNFTESQATLATERMTPDALAKQFFGEDAVYADLALEQQKYVQQVYSQVMTGLTPENFQTRLADIEGQWTEIANSVVTAMKNGVEGVTVEGSFNQASFSRGIQTMAGQMGIQGTWKGQVDDKGKPQVPEADQLAKNLQDADSSLLSVASSAQEVWGILSRFQNFDLMKQILGDPSQIMQFGEMASKLEKFKDLDLETIWGKKGAKTVEQSVSTIEKKLKAIGKMKMDGVFKGMNYSSQQMLNLFLKNTDATLDNVDQRIAQAFDQANELITKNLDEKARKTLSNGKPIEVPMMVQILGQDPKNAEGISSVLNAAFPDGISPIMIPFMIQVFGKEQLDFLGKFGANVGDITNPMGGTTKGGVAYTADDYKLYEGIKNGINAAATLMPFMGGGSLPTPKPVNDKSGGGEKKDPLKELQKTIAEKLVLYTNITAQALKLANTRKKMEKALINARYKGSFVQQLRDNYNLSESFIAELLSKGVDEAKAIVKKAGKGGLQTLNAQFLEGMGAEMVSNNVAAFNNSRTQRRAAVQLNTKAIQRLGKGGNIDQATMDSISGDADKSQRFAQIQNRIRRAEKSGTAKELKAANKEMREFLFWEEKAVQAAKDLERAQNPIRTQIEDMTFAYNQVSQKMDYAIEDQQEVVDKIQDEIDNVQHLIDLENDKVRIKEREKEMIQRIIDEYDRQNEMDQRRISDLQRQDEIRQRISAAMSHDLDIMSQKEQDIREAYDKRLQALEQVAKINEHILNQQKSQISLANSLTSGDIAAAAVARQEMQAADAAYASDQMRQGLETGRDNQIAGLTTEGGLTRQQAEAKIAEIKEQSYQTSLLIRDIEDTIYNRNLLITAEKDKIYQKDKEIQIIQDAIYGLETDILNKTRDQLEPAQNVLTELTKQKAEYDKIFNRNVDSLELAADMADMTDEQKNRVHALGLTWQDVATQIKKAHEIAKTGLSNLGDMPTTPQKGESAKDFAARVQAWKDKRDAIINGREDAIDAAMASGQTATNNFDMAAEPASSAPTQAGGGVKPGTKPATTTKPKPTTTSSSGSSSSSSSNSSTTTKPATEKPVVQGPPMPMTRVAPFYRYSGKLWYADYWQQVSFDGGKTWTKSKLMYSQNLVNAPVGMSATGHAAGGFINGQGGRDSVPSMLTPGEFVMRKAAVDKYGAPMLASMNLGSFKMPRYNVASAATTKVDTKGNAKTSVNAPTYNTYSVSVNVPNTNASPDVIANKVLMRMAETDRMGIRSIRGN